MFLSKIINGTKFCLTLLYFRVREYFFSLNSKVCNLVHVFSLNSKVCNLVHVYSLNSKVCNLVHVLIARFINAGIGTWRQCFGDIGHT